MRVKAVEESDVVRAHRRTRFPSLRAITRYPSNLISCSQPGPDGGLSASAGWQGRMKPGGLERDRIGRETRQSIRNERALLLRDSSFANRFLRSPEAQGALSACNLWNL